MLRSLSPLLLGATRWAAATSSGAWQQQLRARSAAAAEPVADEVMDPASGVCGLCMAMHACVQAAVAKVVDG